MTSKLRQRKTDRKLSDSHRHAPKQEKKLAKKIGGSAVAGSGCGYEKGDVKIDKLVRIECKCTQKQSFSVTRKLAQKIENEALPFGEVPIIQIDFLTGQKVDNKLCVIPQWALEILLENQS